MTILLDLTESCTIAVFWLSLIINSLFIYLTVYQIKNITKTYKTMIVISALIGMFFDGLQITVKPYMHSYNSSLTFFSYSQSPTFSYNFLRLALPVYAGIYALLLSFISIMFFYRHLALKKSELLHHPKLLPSILCILYTLISVVNFSFGFHYFAHPDKFTDDYARVNFRRVYRKELGFLPRYAVVPFGENGEIRWNTIFLTLICALTINFQYVVIAYCGFKIKANIYKKLHNSSYYHRSLEKQCFHALICQIVLPTIFLTLPSMVVLLTLYGNFSISFESGSIYIFYALYTPLESIAFMYIMSEYGKRIEEMYTKYLGVTDGWQNQQHREWVHTVF